MMDMNANYRMATYLSLCAVYILSVVACSPSVYASETYTYDENLYTGVINAGMPPETYTLADKITGSFTLDAPLGDNQSLTFVFPTSFSFFDGLDTYNQSNVI
jgi:hypothetical protein